MIMKLKDGKSKTVTLSYDDGVVQDIRLIEIMNRYGLKGTFNINTGAYLAEDSIRDVFYGRMTLSEAKKLYTNSGHEVALHSLTHPFLEQLNADDVLHEVREDRKNIEQQYGVLARGMAYPFGTYSDDVIDTLKKCGICYSRTVKSTYGFDFPEDWLTLHPTCHHGDPNLMEMAHIFVEESIGCDGMSRMFYLWGHSYEFDDNGNWDIIEKFSEYIGGREDIWYATNIEIYDYVEAYNALQISVDGTMVHNPSALDVWFSERNKMYCIHGGETLDLK